MAHLSLVPYIVTPIGASLAQVIIGFATFAVAAIVALKLTSRFDRNWLSVTTFFALWIGMIVLLSGAFSALRHAECRQMAQPYLCEHDD